jgi:hypothetical protein
MIKFGIDITQPSTMRGLVWACSAIIGVIMIFLGKDISQLLLLTAAIAGGLGIAVKDKQ